jgi:hypothetical protein
MDSPASRWARWRARLPAFLREHGLPLLLFTLLSLALSWPVVAHFGDTIAGDGGDARHNLWIFWHTKEALLGRQPLFTTDLLFYPYGISLLTHGLGPVMGIFALPFWPWGAEAAHNGALLVGMVLTGYFMYLLARGWGLNRPVSFFAGLVLLTAPMHLAGIDGHMTKVFLGLIPLVLLALYRALDLNRSRWWALGTALVLLAILLHNGYQFVFAVIVIGFFTLWALLSRPRTMWWPLAKRIIWLGFCLLVVVGPLFYATYQAGQDVAITVDKRFLTYRNQPDVAEVVLPSANSRLFGERVRQFLSHFGVQPQIETAVSLSVTGVLLCAVAFLADRKRSLPWIILLAGCVIFLLGPTLKILNHQHFTFYELPLIMPFALLTELPGLSFMSASGRFMMIGYVAFGMAAALGLNALGKRWPRVTLPLVLAASGLLLLETWPEPWPVETLREVPAFYQELAADPGTYGVFDLPVMPLEAMAYYGYHSHYQMYQMTHGKGIVAGYLSRVYDVHPLFPCLIPEFKEGWPDLLLNGEVVHCYANTLFDLNYHNYRYVVRHKPQPSYPRFTADSWGDAQAQLFVDRFFAGQEPLVDDDLVTVYAVPPADPSDLTPLMSYQENWYGAEAEWRWAQSPASLLLSMPRPVSATLEMVPYAIYEPEGDQVVGDEGVLHLELNGEPLPAVTIRNEEVARVPLQLPAGVHTLTLDLEAGNFRPQDYREDDPRTLSFAIRALNLVTE